MHSPMVENAPFFRTQTGTEQLALKFHAVREYSLQLAAPLTPEDQCVQSMPDASPTKWHLAHTSWFFETLVLLPYLAGYRRYNEQFHYLFNSYYETLGARHPRPQRGLLTRPTLADVVDYRAHVDNAIDRLLDSVTPPQFIKINSLIMLGIQHEQQHQELIITDILHAFSCNPLLPAYQSATHKTLPTQNSFTQPLSESMSVADFQWVELQGGLVSIGHTGDEFAFDNELPRHRVWLEPFQMASRLVTCREFFQFMQAGGYERPEYWLSEGWAAVQTGGWRAPLYWIFPGDKRAPSEHWQTFGLTGVQRIDWDKPVMHVSFYEAAAYAQWAQARLPTEYEWECASSCHSLQQLHDTAWQWCRSSYDPYPGYQPPSGPIGEYNGKFMVGQLVLRGGSLATPAGHSRRTYRNFFPPAARWQFAGIRLARESAKHANPFSMQHSASL